jgi:anaerobic magnesium-protoporphyrin IX monomethyl ester cyclase
MKEDMTPQLLHQNFCYSSKALLAYKRVLFCFCPTGKFCREDRCQSYFSFELIPSLRSPLEECEAAGAIKEVGGKAKVIDAPALGYSDDKFLAEVKAWNPDCVIIVTTFGSLKEDCQWADKLSLVLKKGTPIGVRGAPALVLAEQLLESFPAVDFCVQGEYELVFAELVQLGFQASRGVVRRSLCNNSIEFFPAPKADALDELPFPDRDGIDLNLYKVRGIGKAQATIRVQRGCPYPCSYCLVATVSGRKPRHRSPNSIIAEMKQLVALGITSFYLRADTFTLNKKWASSVCRAIANEVPQARWVTTTRLDCLDEELLKSLRQAGCYGLSFGADVVSPRIAWLVKKQAPSIHETTKILRSCDKLGIISLLYVMVGFLWEDEQSLADTEMFIHKSRPDLVTVHYAHPYPGTAYYRAVQEACVPILSPLAQATPALEPFAISTTEIKRRVKKLVRRHYLRPTVAYSLVKKGASLLLGGS